MTAAKTPLTSLARGSGSVTENQQYQTKAKVITPSTLGYARPAASSSTMCQLVARWLMAVATGQSNQAGWRPSIALPRNKRERDGAYATSAFPSDNGRFLAGDCPRFCHRRCGCPLRHHDAAPLDRAGCADRANSGTLPAEPGRPPEKEDVLLQAQFIAQPSGRNLDIVVSEHLILGDVSPKAAAFGEADRKKTPGVDGRRVLAQPIGHVVPETVHDLPGL